MVPSQLLRGRALSPSKLEDRIAALWPFFFPPSISWQLEPHPICITTYTPLKNHLHPRQMKNQTLRWPKNLAQPKNKVSENCFPYAQLAAPKQVLGAPRPTLTASCSHSALLGSSQETTTRCWASRKVFTDLLIFPFELLPFFWCISNVRKLVSPQFGF